MTFCNSACASQQYHKSINLILTQSWDFHKDATQPGITSTFNILPSANQGPACQTSKAATKWNYLLNFKFRRKVASRADFSDRFGILANASSWNSFGIGSSQFDDIQIPSEVFSAVVKAASTGCLKNWVLQKSNISRSC